MNYRIWYAQLDVFDTIRRYLALLTHWQGPAPDKTRLFITDFYYVNPPLLHNVHMPTDVRRSFNEIKIEKAQNTFIQYPSPQLLFIKMGGIQSNALHHLVGKGMVEVSDVNKNRYRLSNEGIKIAENLVDKLVLDSERSVLNFLTNEFVKVGSGKGGLRSVTGLNRLGA
ncbi:ABC-three component system middle component 5 [Brucella sp. JSBI001]|uniref:ABC-three component system middle component 5 n=1 Tax=Brucella sp. JSBI001 TaxID=2886044 RepID=UPI002231E1D8|nr:ABC-three component system middle component 5 [Brucella sp. JSBI001]UZD68530.1 hypothetical protein LJ361_15440 [Brucella sp. JSBI001]